MDGAFLASGLLLLGLMIGCSSHGSHASPSEEGGVDTGLAQDAVAENDSAADSALSITPIALPDGLPGIGFDDLRYAPVIKKVLAPAGRSGNLDLVDPSTLEVKAIGGFSMSASFTPGGHTNGVTSADEGGGKLFAIDHETMSVRVFDAATRATLATASLAGAPDYVRWVESTGEVWVTEPGTGLEVLSVGASSTPAHEATIAVTGGPEAIVVDNTRHRVYTNSFTGQTYAVDLVTRSVVETWTNGCGISLGIALDEARGFVLVACQAGSVVVLDVAHGGTKLGQTPAGSGLDIVSYNPSLHHLYVPGSGSGDLTIVAISTDGSPAILGTVATVQGSNEVTADEVGNAWVADSAGGQLLKVADPYPANP